MQIYNNNSGKLEQIKEVGFKLERDMQKFTEELIKQAYNIYNK